MQGTNRSGGEREEPAMWPQIWVATRREREKKGEDNKWDGNQNKCMKSAIIANSVKYENRAEIYCGSGKQEIRETFVGK